MVICWQHSTPETQSVKTYFMADFYREWSISVNKKNMKRKSATDIIVNLGVKVDRFMALVFFKCMAVWSAY